MTTPLKKKRLVNSQSANKDTAALPQVEPFVLNLDQPRSIHDKNKFNPATSMPYSSAYPDPDVKRIEERGGVIISSETFLPRADGSAVLDTYNNMEKLAERDRYQQYHNIGYSGRGVRPTPINFDDDMSAGLSV